MLYKKGKRLKRYKNNEKNNNKLIYAIEELILIFAVATISIILYDIYINVDVVQEENYGTIKTAKEVNIDSESDISEILENTSKSVVRNIQNCNKRYRNI